MSIFDLIRLSDEALLEAMEETLTQFPKLRRLYCLDFLPKLSRKRNYANFLLWLLASKTAYARTVLAGFESLLSSLSDELEEHHRRTGSRFADRLLLTDEPSIMGALTELEWISHLKSVGSEVEIEPPLPGKSKTPEVRAIIEGQPLNLEVKSIMSGEEVSRHQVIATELTDRLRKLGLPFLYSVTFQNSFLLTDVVPFVGFVRVVAKRLTIRDYIFFPVGFDWPGADDKAKARVYFTKTSRDGFFAVNYPAIGPRSSDRVRERLKEASKQMAPDQTNVIVIDATDPHVNFAATLRALYGDEQVVWDRATRQIVDQIRSKERFYNGVNTRVSAVLFYKREFEQGGFIRVLTIVPNPYAKFPLSQAVVDLLQSISKE